MGAGRDRGGDRATTGRPTGQTRYTVPVAADLLGITGEGVRSRIKRGTLPTDREAGAVFVVLEANRATDQVRQGVDQSTDRAAGQDPREKLVEELRDRITYLDVQLDARTEELREHRWLLAAALERIPPQLEAAEAPVSSGPDDTPLDRTGGQQAATEGREGGPEEGRRRSWWRASFGFGE
jgi:hypothetical protein